MNLEPIFKPLNQIEKQTIQRTIASLKNQLKHMIYLIWLKNWNKRNENSAR